MSLYSTMIVLLMALFEFHNIHITYSKVALEKNDVTIKTNFFLDDFELALSEFHGKKLENLTHDGSTDSLFAPYLRQYFLVISNGDTLSPTIINSGIEADMCYYLVGYHTEKPIKNLTFSNSLLFKEFADQKNLISVTHLDTEETWSFYCIEGEYTYSLSTK